MGEYNFISSNFDKTELLYDPKVKWVKENILLPSQDGSLYPTNAIGKVYFKGATRRATAKFARVNANDEGKKIFELLTAVMDLEQPRLLISVTGGAKSFSLSPTLKSQLTIGLAKVAQTPGAWVITGGTNTGVMKQVGEALQGTSKACIGISTWGIITNANKLISAGDKFGGGVDYQVACSLVQRGAFLDHNHTHHLMVDDGSIGKYGKEIPLRSRLEEYIMKEVHVPSVLMVIEGGPGTLDTVLAALMKEPPLSVVIIVGSGRAADLLAYTYNRVVDIDAVYNVCDKLLFNKLLDLLPELQSQTKERQMDFYKVVLNCMRKRDFITLFEISNKNGVDEAILKALLTGGEELSLYKQLKLTYSLKCKFCNASKSPITYCKYNEKDLNSVMIMALAMNRVDFIKLFLNFGISIQSLLTADVLQFLYGYGFKNHHSVFKKLIKDKHYLPATGDYIKVMKTLCRYKNHNPANISLSLKKIQKIIGRACSIFVRNKETDKFIVVNKGQKEFSHPYKQLFFFALLSNMPELAHYVWGFEEECLLKAFFGIVVNNYLAEKARKHNLPDDIRINIEKNEFAFRKLCTSLLDQCFKINREKTEKLITNISLEFNLHTCLNLAVLCDHKEFISHNAVQTILNDVWFGPIKDLGFSRMHYLLAYFCPLYISTFQFKNTDHDAVKFNENIVKNEEAYSTEKDSNQLIKNIYIFNDTTLKSKELTEIKVPIFKKIWSFYFKVPVVKFMSHLFGYLIFLIFFGYVAMLIKDTTTPSITEWILVLYIGSLTIEELRQVIHDEAFTAKRKLYNWWSSYWNRLDAAALLVFYLALAFRFNQKTLPVAQVLYAIDAGMWVIRLLNVYYVDIALGPYVIMISKMFKDMVNFLLILFVFLLAYGISVISILVPQEAGFNMIIDVFFHPYFNIYGELFVERDAQSNVTRFGTPEMNNYSEFFAWILLGCYLLVANVLLLNLLIAIFNNTFEEVQSNADTIWKFERYKLVLEYANRPPLIPPFILLCHIYMLGKYLTDMFFYQACQQEEKEFLFTERKLTEQELDEVNEFENECKLFLLRKQEEIGDNEQ
ncbi:transient receptor potential cation channel subfamily M member 1 isoform X1 [Hydra vulgaris]|uniref:transient receptor potential cation channel subfamily M member 1 isoform X1 n=1 Tax=Hydra vulgaris TaxID=6087 RepID=UPI0032EA57C1